jgi:hypothetical protein
MPDSHPSPELMRALGRLVRGLSALFWGLPLALVIGVQLALKNRLELRLFDAFFPLAANGLLLYGVGLLADFQKQERIWTQALDRARVLGLVLTGLAPFLYWHAKLPEVQAYSVAVLMLAGFSLMFLYHLNYLLQRLVAMLPDEALRHETMMFTTLNQYLLAAIPLGIALVLLLASLLKSDSLPPILARFVMRSESANEWIFLLLALLPVATTMALIWKIKEAVLDSLFGPGR